MSKLTLELSNDQALHLWSITTDYIDDKTSRLKTAGVLKGDGTRNLRKKYISDYLQALLDSLAVAELIYKFIEENADFSELEKEAGL